MRTCAAARRYSMLDYLLSNGVEAYCRALRVDALRYAAMIVALDIRFCTVTAFTN